MYHAPGLVVEDQEHSLQRALLNIFEDEPQECDACFGQLPDWRCDDQFKWRSCTHVTRPCSRLRHLSGLSVPGFIAHELAPPRRSSQGRSYVQEMMLQQLKYEVVFRSFWTLHVLVTKTCTVQKLWNTTSVVCKPANISPGTTRTAYSEHYLGDRSDSKDPAQTLSCSSTAGRTA